MNVHRLIIHQLEKEARSTEIKYNSSNSLITVDERIDGLVTQIHASFERSLTKYSKFNLSKPYNSVFLNTNKYLEVNDDNTFIEFSTTSLGELAGDIQREPFATGGYYVFLDYTENSFRYISIVILRNREAFNIKWIRDKFSIDETENINIDKLAMGFRVNCNLYANTEDDRNYLALVSNQGDELSKYFIRWVNADKVITNQVNTKTLVNIIKDLGSYDKSISQDDFERSVFDWIDAYKKQNDNKIDVDSLSNSLYGDPLKIRTYANEAFKTEVDPVFKINGTELNRLIRLRATTKGITVTIDTDKFDNEEVEISNGILIIRNQIIVESLRNQRENKS